LILVTGAGGFIGGHLVEALLAAGNKVISFDKMTYAANADRIETFHVNPKHHFVKGDITNPESLRSVFQDYAIDTVFHLAAESHVDNSIADPSEFVLTNVVGTYQLLEVCRGRWMSGIGVLKPECSEVRFIHVSTDEVFGALQSSGYFSETSPYLPNSPYSASKASSDHFARAYFKTYGLPTLITNCSNNFGPYQHAEKLIPTIIRNALAGHTIPIYGKGQNVRDWIYVNDHVRALLNILQYGQPGGNYAIGGACEWSNLDLDKEICQHLDHLKPREDSSSYQAQIGFVQDRAGHDFRYAIESIHEDVIWQGQARTDFSGALEKTVACYLNR